MNFGTYKRPSVMNIIELTSELKSPSFFECFFISYKSKNEKFCECHDVRNRFVTQSKLNFGINKIMLSILLLTSLNILEIE